MAALSAQAKAFNQTRQAYLATSLAVADTHWTRLRGLLGLGEDDFRNGSGLWIVPCHGVHTLGMGFADRRGISRSRHMTVIDVQTGGASLAIHSGARSRSFGIGTAVSYGSGNKNCGRR